MDDIYNDGVLDAIINQIATDSEGEAFYRLIRRQMAQLGQTTMTSLHVALAVLDEPRPEEIPDWQWEEMTALVRCHGLIRTEVQIMARLSPTRPSAYDDETCAVLVRLKGAHNSNERLHALDRGRWSWPNNWLRIALASESFVTYGLFHAN